jgi:hypothetical protein
MAWRRSVVSGSRRLISLCELGNRSSVDEARSDGPEDETTVVEPDQGNGEEYNVGKQSLVTDLSG